MLSAELLGQVRRIELTTRRVVNDVVSGRYRSHFKGHGMQFSEHRVYVPGDDVRHIDWKVSARTRDPLVKKYEEERELSVLIVADISASQGFGSQSKLKSQVLAEIGGILAFAATRAGDKVGALLFAEEVERLMPPRKGRQNALHIVRELLGRRPHSPKTALAQALDVAGRTLKHSGIVFVLSDFFAPNYALSLKRLSRRHDVVVIRIEDQRENEIPEMGKLLVRDPESGQERFIDTSSYAFKKWLQGFKKKREEEFQSALAGTRSEVLRVATQEDYAEAVVRFFQLRSRSGAPLRIL